QGDVGRPAARQARRCRALARENTNRRRVGPECTRRWRPVTLRHDDGGTDQAGQDNGERQSRHDNAMAHVPLLVTGSMERGACNCRASGRGSAVRAEYGVGASALRVRAMSAEYLGDRVVEVLVPKGGLVGTN